MLATLRTFPLPRDNNIEPGITTWQSQNLNRGCRPGLGSLDDTVTDPSEIPVFGLFMCEVTLIPADRDNLH
jgi:hypothetical protein